MADINNYKCPNCAGTMQFDGSKGRVVCDYCGSDFDVKEIDKLMSESSESASLNTPDEWTCEATGWDPQGLQAYSCPSCGAGLVCDDTTASTSCPYCGNPTIVPSQLEGALQPEVVVPFKVDKAQAVEKLHKFYGKKFFLPKAFKNENAIQDVHGVYVPFWLYDGMACGDATYHAEKKHTTRQGDYEIEKTEHYVVHRSGEVKFEKIPADASSKMPDDLMDSIEPFDYKELQPFSKGYLAGYMADRYDVTKEENAERAKKRASNTLDDLLEETVTGYTSKHKAFSNIHVRQGKITYAMMPVWMLTTKWKDKNYTFAMNGQTGKMVGNLPMDKLKAFITTLISFVIPLAIALACLGTESIIPSLAIASLVAIITFFLFKSQLRTVAEARTSREYIVGKGLKLTRKSDRYLRTTEKRRKINNNN